MPILTKSGYVKSFRGNNGGYMLAKKPEEYTAGEILRAAEGSLAPVGCIEDEPNACGHYEQCRTCLLYTSTSGPSINILIKLMTVVSLVFAPLFLSIGGLL